MAARTYIMALPFLFMFHHAMAAVPYQTTFDAISRPSKTYEQYVQFVISPNTGSIEDSLSRHRKMLAEMGAILLAHGQTGRSGSWAVMSLAVPKEHLKALTEAIQGSGRLISQTIQTEAMDIESQEAQAIQRRDEAANVRDQVNRLATNGSDRLLSVQSLSNAERDLAQAQSLLREIQQRRQYIFVNIQYYTERLETPSLQPMLMPAGLGLTVGLASAALLAALFAVRRTRIKHSTNV